MAVGKEVLATRNRRSGWAGRTQVETKWFIDEVVSKVSMTLKQRAVLTKGFLVSKVVQNISRPVTKRKSNRTGRIVVSNRSKGGEFPKADTTQLRKDIFGVVLPGGKDIWDIYIGTTLDYGLILEISKRLNRSFLVKTLIEELPVVNKILTGPIK